MARFSALLRQGRRAARGDRRSAGRAAVLPLSTSLEALGSQFWTELGPVDARTEQVVGTVARVDDFDRAFRPLIGSLRRRWERVAAATDLPPPRLIQLGELFFVADGHHRVSVARARGTPVLQAHVRRVCTVAYACHCLTVLDLPAKAAERRFLERFPLPDDVRRWLWLDDPAGWALVERQAAEWLAERSSDAQLSEEALEELLRNWWERDVLPNAHACRGGQPVRLEDYVCAVRDRYAAGACVC